MSVTPAIIIAVRGGPAAKSRLAGVLDAARREALVATMLAHMLAATRGWPTYVVTPTPELADLATAVGVTVIADLADDLNAAFALARAQLAGPLLLLPGDLPLLTRDDLAAACHAGSEGKVLIAPTHDGGTGALLLPARAAIATAFGPDSATRHQRLAEAAGHPVALFHRPGFAQDCDTPADLVRIAPLSRKAA